MRFMPDDVPILVAPNSIYFKAASLSLTPPAALICNLLEFSLKISMSLNEAPLGPKPVEVFIKSAPALSTTCVTFAISYSVR